MAEGHPGRCADEDRGDDRMVDINIMASRQMNRPGLPEAPLSQELEPQTRGGSM